MNLSERIAALRNKLKYRRIRYRGLLNPRTQRHMFLGLRIMFHARTCGVRGSAATMTQSAKRVGALQEDVG